MNIIKHFKWGIVFIALIIVGFFGSNAMLGTNMTLDYAILGGFGIMIIGSGYLFMRDYRKFRKFGER